MIDNSMVYTPSETELNKLCKKRASKKLMEMLSDTPLNLLDPVPIKTEKQAREYLTLKINAYREPLGYRGDVRIIIDKYISWAMNELLASGFTYVNLYAKDYTFLREPHIAAALAFNTVNHIQRIPDSIDLQYGLTYGGL